MILFPAIDLYEKAIRLTKGDYTQMTVYSDKPGRRLFVKGRRATHLPVVDPRAQGTGRRPILRRFVRLSDERPFTEVGGGIRTREVIEKYLDIGVERVILGTAAITEPGFVDEMVALYGERIAIGVDMKDGYVAVKGWTEVTSLDGVDFCRQMESKGVRTIICTDISKDGVLGGANNDLYRRLKSELSLNIIASGGISSLKDIIYLGYLGLYGAILGKALYEGRIDLKEAIESMAEGVAADDYKRIIPCLDVRDGRVVKVSTSWISTMCPRPLSWGDITATAGPTSLSSTTSPRPMRNGGSLPKS